MEQFLKTLKKDKEAIPNLVRFIERVVADTMEFGEEGFQPVFGFSIFAKQTEGQLEVKFRPIRTSDTNTYEVFQFEKLGEQINEAIKTYAQEVWGMTPIDEREEVVVDSGIVDAWKGVVGDDD